MAPSPGGAPRRVLFAVQNFRQGWGGAPESVRLMAAQLQRLNISSDVYDRGHIVRDVGRLPVLPDAAATFEAFDLGTTADYAAILQTGPWQSPQGIRRLWRRQGRAGRWIYLPRGGLATAEFSRPRHVMKYLYLHLVERALIAAADTVVYSSDIERRRSSVLKIPAAKAVIIPDFVASPPDHAADGPAAGAVITFAFLGEISPRKGLHLLVEAFIRWVRAEGLSDRVRLVVGGAPRPGSEAYLGAIRSRHAAVRNEVDITFLGAVAHEDRAAFYAATDVLVVASSFESFGLTVFEALSEGCAVLSTPDVGALEQLSGAGSLTVALTASVDGMVLGLSAATRNLGLTTREERTGAAVGAIRPMNESALSRWLTLLFPDAISVREGRPQRR